MKSSTVSMPRKEAIKEHARLVGVLRTGSARQREAEAEDQAKELKGYRSGARKKERRSARR